MAKFQQKPLNVLLLLNGPSSHGKLVIDFQSYSKRLAYIKLKFLIKIHDYWNNFILLKYDKIKIIKRSFWAWNIFVPLLLSSLAEAEPCNHSLSAQQHLAEKTIYKIHCQTSYRTAIS